MTERKRKSSAQQRRRAKTDRAYSDLRKAFLEAHPWCEIKWDHLCLGRATEVDHRVNRSQRPDLYLATEHWQAGCRNCHHMVTTNPAEAHRRGLALWSWEVPA